MVAVDGTGGETRSMRVVGGGAFDDQEGGVVGGLLADVGEQVIVDVMQQGIGAVGGEGGDAFGERVEGSGR